MADLITTLADILCQQGTSQKCISFVQAYPDITQQLLFFVFFPAVFLIIFITLLSTSISSVIGGKYRVLLAAAILVFIVIQGWYHFFLLIGQFWFIFVIVLVGLFLIIRHLFGGVWGGHGGGGGGGGRHFTLPTGGKGSKGGVISQLATRAGKVTKGEIRKQEDVVENALHEMERTVKILKNPSPEDRTRMGDLLNTFRSQNTAVEVALKALDQIAQIGGYTVGTRYNEFEKKWKRLNLAGIEAKDKSMRR